MFLDGELNAPQRLFFERRPAECLYDIEKDPHSINNLADNPTYSRQLVAMRALLQKQVKSMPDLGFIPEPIFLAEGRGNPGKYGQRKKQEIAKLVDIADLSLKAFPEAKQQIGKALASKNPLDRYWGLITCSAFGEQAAPFYKKAAAMAASDGDRLVRVRAAEFLGLTGTADPRPVIMDVLRQTTDPSEANLILNSVVLLEDGTPGYDFDVKEFKSAKWSKVNPADRRMEYLIK